MYLKNSNRGFTFVELIVVITILTILSTIGFTVYQEYISNSRDSNRIVQLGEIHNGLEVLATQTRLPFPENMLEITSSGSILSYQGDAGEKVIQSIGYDGGGLDPEYGTPFVYTLAKNARDFQLMTFVSDVGLLSFESHTFADTINYQNLFPKTKGKKIGIILEKNSNTPIQRSTNFQNISNYDVITGTGNLMAYFSDTDIVDSQYESLGSISQDSSCKRINELGNSNGDGYYNLNLPSSQNKSVYCNMDVAGGGWTLVARSVPGSTINDFGWMIATGNSKDDTRKFSLGPLSAELDFSEIMIASYNTGKIVEYAVKVNVNSSYIKNPQGYNLPSRAEGCEEVYGVESEWNSSCDLEKSGLNYFHSNWGFVSYKNDEAKSGFREEGYFFRYYATPTNSGPITSLYGLRPNGFSGGDNGDFSLGNGGMIFVR